MKPYQTLWGNWIPDKQKSPQPRQVEGGPVVSIRASGTVGYPPSSRAGVVELAVSTGGLRSFPDSNNKIEQTGKSDEVCKSERCLVKGWGRTECC